MLEGSGCLTRMAMRRALLVSVSGLAAVLSAQSADAQTAPPSRSQLDPNGVNLANGTQVLVTEDVSIGPAGAGHLGLQRQWASGASSNTLGPAQGNYLGLYLTVIGSTYYAYVWTANGMEVKTFSLSGTTYTSLLGDGSTLVQSGSSWVLTLSNGNQITYGYTTLGSSDTAKALASQINYGNGEVVYITYNRVKYCSSTTNPDTCTSNKYLYAVRPQSVYNSYGYMMHFDYMQDTASVPSDAIPWSTIADVVASNLATDYCAPAATSCAYSQTWPTVTYTTTTGASNAFPHTATSTDALGNTTTYSFDATTFSVKTPASGSANFISTRNGNGIASVTRSGSNWIYSFSLSSNLMTATVTDPNNGKTTVVSDTNVGLPVSITDPLNNKTSYTYDSYGRLASQTFPELNQSQYIYDTRGNLTQTVQIAKSGSGLANIVTTAGYDATCSNAVKCNQPNWTKDALGNETDYTYDPTSGFVTSVTGPAASSGGLRPQVRKSYATRQAYYKNSAGAIVASGQNTYVLTNLSVCLTKAGATLSGAAGVGPFTLSSPASCSATPR